MTTNQNHRRELVQALEGFRERIGRDHPECECDIFEDLGEPNRFLWTERWATPEEADRSRESERFRALLGAVKVLGTLEAVRRITQRRNGDRGFAKRPQTDNRA